MRRGGKPSWKILLLRPTSASGCGELSRSEWLAALYRFQNAEAPSDLCVVDPMRDVVVTDAAEVDWTHFPVVEALEAITYDELRRLRSLLSTDCASPAPVSAFPTLPNGLVWPIGLPWKDEAPESPRPTMEA